MVTLQNDYLTVTFVEECAQIHSVISKHYDIEYIHDGVNGWGQQNPLLFPMIGNTANKEQIINGKTYHMSNHGVVRRAKFEVVEQGDDFVTFTKKADASTLELYPFNFELKVTYHLVNDGLNITYRIFNHDATDMPFQFGLHPAFKCPLTQDKSYDDYYVEFEKHETKKGLIGEFSLDSNKFQLNHGLFEKAATILFDKVDSSWVKVSDGVHGVKVSLDGYDHLAFWTPGDAQLVCIEPWCGHGDFGPETPCEFEDRENTVVLEPQNEWTVKVNYSFF